MTRKRPSQTWRNHLRIDEAVETEVVAVILGVKSLELCFGKRSPTFSTILDEPDDPSRRDLSLGVIKGVEKMFVGVDVFGPNGKSPIFADYSVFTHVRTLRFYSKNYLGLILR